MVASIRRTKLNRPRIPHNLVARSGLVDRLNAATGQDLILVTAPIGFGKSTLVAHWADQAPQPVAWLTLDEDDNDLVLFLTYIVAAVRTLFPDALPETHTLLSGTYTPERSVLATFIVNEIDDLPQHFTLVLDDYHAIHTPAIHALLDDILRHPSFQLNLLIASRADPPLALSRLRASQRLTELRARDLRFSAGEASEFLTKALGANPSTRAKTVIDKHTEGWIAGMQLAALSLRTSPDQNAVLEALERGVDRVSMDYLFEQVLRQQSPSVQRFLLKTSILERISQPLADALVTDETHSPLPTLPEIEGAGLLLQALDNTGDWYAYHALFRTLLRHQLQLNYSQPEIALLHLRATTWLASNDLTDEAVHHALAATDLDLAVRLVIERFIGPLGREDWRTIARWLELLPTAAFEQHPALLIVKATVLQIQSNWSGLAQLLDQAESNFTRSDDTIPAPERRALRGYLDILWSLHWSLLGKAPRAIETAERALENLSDDDLYGRGTAETNLIMAMQATGFGTRAEELIRTGLTATQRNPGNRRRLLTLLLNLMSLQVTAANLVAAQQSAAWLRQAALEFNAPVSQVWAELVLGICAYEVNDLGRAATHFERGADFGIGGHVRGTHECLVNLALTYQAIERSAEANRVATILADAHFQLSNAQLVAEGVSLHHHLAVLNGVRPVDIAPCDTQSALPALWFGWREVPAVTYLRSLLLVPTGAKLDQALILADELLSLASSLHKVLRTIEFLALKATVHELRHERAPALKALSAAIEMAEPRNLIRAVADAGIHLDPLLEILMAERSSSYLKQVRAILLSAQTRNGAAVMTNVPNPVRIRLTRREREVLALLAAHMTDREIAEKLVISPLTVRTHIEHIGEKLDVRGRRAITTRALKLGLST